MYLCISCDEERNPPHRITTMTTSATKVTVLDLFRNWKTALYGGRRALADFQVTPPLGSNIVEKCSLADELRGREM